MALRDVNFHAGAFPVVANVTAQAEAGDWANLLEAQLRSPVLWTESVQTMRTMGVDTFIECGAGEVLCGLIRRIDREAATKAVFDMATLEALA
jgi:[acyl-carrier-protein] S-malonyltransferase